MTIALVIGNSSSFTGDDFVDLATEFPRLLGPSSGHAQSSTENDRPRQLSNHSQNA